MASGTASNEILDVELYVPSSRERINVAFDIGQEYTIGSDDGNKITLKHDGVQPRHALISNSGGGLQIVPIGSNAITLNGKPIDTRVPLKDGDWLLFGSTLCHIRLAGNPITSEKADSASSSAVNEENASDSNIRINLTIGRTAECDLTIASPIVSSLHAHLNFEQGNWLLVDHSSTNGTYVNGVRITQPQALHEGDRVAIANFNFIFTGDELKPQEDFGRVRIEIRELGKHVADRSGKTTKRLLDRINLVIESGEFVSVFGTSGSGKSTLLDALNGRRRATEGQVLYNGMDFYRAYDRFRASIGYVPQQDIVHRKIRMKNALKYTARLRLPPDTSEAEVDNYISEVLQQVGLEEKAELPVDTPVPLSGGQLKRVSLAVELVANPNVLFLDEVTSGLDAGTDKKMMQLFAKLASSGKTVVCITHTLENITACDLVVLLHQGRIVYFGPPEQATQYFGIERLSDVYELLESSQPGIWADQFQTSAMYQTYVLDRFSKTLESTNCNSDIAAAQNRAWFSWRQTTTLLCRNLDLLLSDYRNLAILLLQAPLIGAVIGSVFSIEGNNHEIAVSESQIVFILVLSAIWFGCLNSARELVKELPIYLRERSVNLAILPYLMSKLIPLAVLCLLQCTTLLAIVRLLLPLSGQFIDQLGILFLAGMAATAMGLTVSAFVDSNDKAVAIVPILLIPQVILSNAVVPLENAGEAFAKATMISFWAFDGLKTTLAEPLLAVKNMQGEPILPVVGSFTSDLGVIVVFFMVFLICAVTGLLLKDRQS